MSCDNTYPERYSKHRGPEKHLGPEHPLFDEVMASSYAGFKVLPSTALNPSIHSQAHHVAS